MNNRWNNKDVLTKEQSRDYADNLVKGIKNYNIYDKNVDQNLSNFSTPNNYQTLNQNYPTQDLNTPFDYNNQYNDQVDNSNFVLNEENEFNDYPINDNSDDLTFSNDFGSLKNHYDLADDIVSNDILLDESKSNVNLSQFGFKNPNQNYNQEFVEYVSRKKIKKILAEKYGINSKEAVNFLYQKVLVHKWNEISLEKWLLNPANMETLKKKIKQNDTNQKDSEINYENQKNLSLDSIVTTHKIEPVQAQTNNTNNIRDIKEDLKSVIVEENYRKMQFDMQTEILKNHINDKLFNLANSITGLNNNILNGNNQANHNNDPSNNSQQLPQQETSTNNNTLEKEELKKAISEEMEKISSIFNDKFGDSINTLNNHVSYLSESLGEKIHMLEEQVATINNSFSSIDNKSDSLNEKLNTFANDIKEDYQEKIDDMKKQKEESFEILESKIYDLKNSMFDEFKSEMEKMNKQFKDFERSSKNKIDISNLNLDEISTLDHKINEIEDGLDDKINSFENNIDKKINSMGEDINNKFDSKIDSIGNDIDEKIHLVESNISEKLKEAIESINKKLDEKTQINPYPQNNPNLDSYNNFLDNIDNNLNEVINDTNNLNQIQSSKPIEEKIMSPKLSEENRKVNEVIDKSIDDISEVIDSLQSLNVSDEIINSFEETSNKFKNIK